MKIYRNRSGHSGVSAYETGKDHIIVYFADEGYLYNYENPGKKHVDQMIQLAEKGEGLATYINKYVREKFFRMMDN